MMFFAVMQLKLGHLLLSATSLFMSILVTCIKIFYIHLGSDREGTESKLGVLKASQCFQRIETDIW